MDFAKSTDIEMIMNFRCADRCCENCKHYKNHRYCNYLGDECEDMMCRHPKVVKGNLYVSALQHTVCDLFEEKAKPIPYENPMVEEIFHKKMKNAGYNLIPTEIPIELRYVCAPTSFSYCYTNSPDYDLLVSFRIHSYAVPSNIFELNGYCNEFEQNMLESICVRCNFSVFSCSNVKEKVQTIKDELMKKLPEYAKFWNFKI